MWDVLLINGPLNGTKLKVGHDLPDQWMPHPAKPNVSLRYRAAIDSGGRLLMSADKKTVYYRLWGR